jgi:hypothetical protein
MIWLCTACGTSYAAVGAPPARCPVCEDERQYVPAAGQDWTTPAKLAAGHRNAWQQLEDGLLSIQTVPAFGINQRALLLRTPAGNILWDCIALLDDATRALVHGLGGLHGIAISHPHYYTTMQDWAEAFGCPVHLHAADHDWVMRPSPALRFWEGESLEPLPGVRLHRVGGHFPGGTVLHWNDLLLAGDIVQVAPGGRRVSFMWSYPNMMPLPAAEIRAVAARLAPLRYQRIHGAFQGQLVREDGPSVVVRSAARYLELLGE